MKRLRSYFMGILLIFLLVNIGRPLIAQHPELPEAVEELTASSEIRKESNGDWLYLDGKKVPAFIGMVYQPVPANKNIEDFADNFGDLYNALLDPEQGGKGHAKQLAQLKIDAIRIYELPMHNLQDVDRVKEIFRRIYNQYHLKVLIGYWAGLHSGTFDQESIISDAMQMVFLYGHEPWILGWQIGNENNYYIQDGRLGSEIDLSLNEYYRFMDQVAGAMRDVLGCGSRHYTGPHLCVKQFIALGQGDLTLEEAHFISKMKNIDAVGINAYRSPEGEDGIEQVIQLAFETLPYPIFFSEFGKSAQTSAEEKLQGEYLQQMMTVILSHGAGRLGLGNVLGGFVHEATDEAWKSMEHGNPQDAHFGVLGKQSEFMIADSISRVKDLYRIIPLTDSPEDLMSSAWDFVDRQDYGNSIGYALKVTNLYASEAGLQQELLRNKVDSRTKNNYDKYWALDAVGSAYFLIGKAYYEQNDKENSKKFFDMVTSQYEDSYIRDRDGKYWRISESIRKLFPDLLQPYFRVDLQSVIIIILICSLLFFGKDLLSILGDFRSNVFGKKHRDQDSLKTGKFDSVNNLNQPALYFRDQSGFILLFMVQLGLIIYFIGWWFHPVRLEFHIVAPFLFWILSSVGAIDVVFYFFIWRVIWSMKKPGYLPPENGHRVAMATTFVSSEPIDMLEQTLLAMRDVKYPHDTYVLDESNNPNVRELCAKIGVTHFSRKDIERYNQKSGKFQTRTKGGNINSWLDSYGKKYDFVTFLDPDHKPLPTYLDCVLGYFRIGNVGFVQAPQIYGNQAKNWIARGAAEQTYYFYGPMLLGLHGLDSCIVNGSHSTFRMQALNDIDGYAVHDADDVLTSIRLNAKKWSGIYVPEVLAIGLAPDTWTTFLQQQTRWAYSMLDLFFHHYGRELKGLKLEQRIGYLFLSLYYFLAIGFVLLLLLPLISVLFNYAPVNTELLTFCWYYFPFSFARYVLLIVWSQKFLIRPNQERGIWFRGGLLWVATWPYYLQALLNALPNRAVRPRITTPKNVHEKVFAARMFRPHILLIILNIVSLVSTFVFRSYVWPTQGMRTFLLISLICQFSFVLTAFNARLRD
jgi:cellulose synthase/poly-beta-1,6-N-acetylglucosamine synthase-like glycosyltransferase